MNVYLEKIAEAKSHENKKLGIGKQVVSAGAGASVGAILGGHAAGYSAHLLRKSQLKDVTGVTHEDLQGYVRKNNLRHVQQHSGPGMYINPILGRKHGLGNRPHAQFDSPETGLHEMGHAHSFNSNRKLGGKALLSLKDKMHRFSAISSGAPIKHLNRFAPITAAGLAGAGLATSNNKKVRDAAPYVAGAAAAPMLYEEAKASLHPYMHLRKTRGSEVANKFLKRMAPAFGTYAAAGGAVVGGSMLAKKIANKYREKQK